jgi:hypothetical protein
LSRLTGITAQVVLYKFQVMSNPLYNLRAAYQVMHDRVVVALRIHLGDVTQLNNEREHVLRFQSAAEEASFFYLSKWVLTLTLS